MEGEETMRDRLFQAFELFEFGVEMKAASLRRKHPTATPARIDEMVDEWLAQPDRGPDVALEAPTPPTPAR